MSNLAAISPARAPGTGTKSTITDSGTSVLIYAHDVDAGAKHDVASAL